MLENREKLKYLEDLEIDWRIILNLVTKYYFNMYTGFSSFRIGFKSAE
jgi:hypothetical protein